MIVLKSDKRVAKVMGQNESIVLKTTNKLLGLLLGMAFLLGCFSVSAADSLKLRVQLGFGTAADYTMSISGGNITPYRSPAVVFTNNVAQISAALQVADVYTLTITPSKGGNPLNYPIYLANEEISMQLLDGQGNYSIEKGAHASAFRSLLVTFSGDFSALNEVYSAYQSAATNGYRTDSLDMIREALKGEVGKKVEPYLKQHGNTSVSGFLLYQLWPLKYPMEQYESWSKLMSATAMQHPYGQTFASQMETEKLFGYGQVAPDFAQATPDGKMVKLTDFRGKFVLVDFWASWCGPCRLENPNLVRSYHAHKQNNFTILGVSLDKDKNKWLDAIKADKLDWTHVSDLGFWQNEVARQYRISSIPQNIILDPEGRIIGKNLRGQELDDFLRQLFTNKP